MTRPFRGASRALAAVAFATLAACVRAPVPSPSPAPPPIPQRAGGVIFAGNPPATLVLAARPLDVDPEGRARWLVTATFRDRSGAPTALVSGGDVTFVPSRGVAQWQTRVRFGRPAAIVATDRTGPLAVRVHANVGAPVADAVVRTDPRGWRVPRVVARALGPHAVWIGWFPRETDAVVRVVRAGDGSAARAYTIAPPSSGVAFDEVRPGATYRIAVRFVARAPATLRVDVPREPRHGTLRAFAGKSAWLSFSPAARDADGYEHLAADAIVARARAAGLRSIALRTAYGPFFELTPQTRPAVDALLDAAAAAHIAIVAWTVPRSADFEDLATATASAAYRTARGNGFAGLSIDLERGAYFLGDGAAGYAAMRAYVGLVRTAVGPRYPIVATVEDPGIEHLTGADVPYASIAASADAIEPMVYWRAPSPPVHGSRAVRAAIARSYAATARLAGRPVAIVMGLQSASVGSNGAPPPRDLAAATREARALRALGATYFDWDGTTEERWRAIAGVPW